ALKRRSSVLDDDIGSGGPLRRTRQKANLLMLRDKRELGYTALQQPDHASQKLLLMNESEPKIVKGAEKKRDTSMHGSGSVSGYANVPTKSTQTATKILQHLEEVDLKEKSSGSTKSPPILTLDIAHSRELTSKGTEKVEDNGPTAEPLQKKCAFQMSVPEDDSFEIGTEKVEDNGPTAEPLQKKCAFQMSVPEDDSFEIDDDDETQVLGESCKQETALAADIVANIFGKSESKDGKGNDEKAANIFGNLDAPASTALPGTPTNGISTTTTRTLAAIFSTSTPTPVIPSSVPTLVFGFGFATSTTPSFGNRNPSVTGKLLWARFAVWNRTYSGGKGNAVMCRIVRYDSDLEQVLQQKTFTRSEIERLKALLHSNPYCLPSSLLRLEASNKWLSEKTCLLILAEVLEEEIASPVELEKAYMGSRPSKVALRQDLVLHNNAMGFLKSPNTLIAPKIANGFTTPRSRGRSAMYRMARTPYARSPSTFTQKALKHRSSILDDDIGSGVPLRRTRQKANLALKRISSILDDDIGSDGPLRRTRQKANLLMLRDKRELGYTALQQPDHASQKLLLMNNSEPKVVKGAEQNRDTSMHGSGSVSGYANVPTKSTQTATKILQHLEKSDLKENSGSTKSPTKLTLDMLHGQALRSLEKVDPPKLLSYSHDIQKSEVQHHERLHDSRELTSKGKEKVEDNGPRKVPISRNMMSSVNGELSVTSKDKAPAVRINEPPLKLPVEPPQQKHAFQMSAPEDDSFEIDDDDDETQVNGHVSIPFVESNNQETALAADIVATSTLPGVSRTPALVENNKKMFPKVVMNNESFELDMLLESVNSALKRVEELLNGIKNRSVSSEGSIRVEDHFSALNLRCIERLYGDRGLEVMETLRKSPSTTVWADIYAKNHYKSLDHRSFYLKQQDSKDLSTKCLVAEIKETKEKSRKDDDVLYSVAAGKVCSTKEQVNQVLKLWTTFLELMLYVPSRPENFDNVEYVEISTCGATTNEGDSDGSLGANSVTFNNVKQGKLACNGRDPTPKPRNVHDDGHEAKSNIADVPSSQQGDTSRTPPVANRNFAKFEKEEGELSPNVYFDEAYFSAYGDHNGSNAKEKHSMEIDADADEEDSKNVLEDGDDVSGSQSTGRS
ncbi:hypothetical protein Tco_0534578, partial [Tanacetum coccineum]